MYLLWVTVSFSRAVSRHSCSPWQWAMPLGRAASWPAMPARSRTAPAPWHPRTKPRSPRLRCLKDHTTLMQTRTAQAPVTRSTRRRRTQPWRLAPTYTNPGPRSPRRRIWLCRRRCAHDLGPKAHDAGTHCSRCTLRPRRWHPQIRPQGLRHRRRYPRILTMPARTRTRSTRR